MAMLECVPLDEYLQRIGAKSRNMVRKANREYYYRRIKFNEWTHDIETVARSSPARQGMPMQGWYTQAVVPTRPAALCGLHSDEWYLGLRRADHSPVAFAHVEVLNELAILNSILGVRAAGAAVNGLIAHLVEHVGAKWINYLYPEGKTPSLGEFKRRVGFRPMVVSSSIAPAAGITA